MLASLLNIPKTPQEWNIWSFSHLLSHRAIIQAVQAQKGISLVEYVLEPIPFDDISRWLEANSEMHINMTASVGLQSHDIQDVNFKDQNQLVSWIATHHAEHYDVEVALGIGS